MEYSYNYRLGLLIQRKGKIDIVSKQDMVNLYSEPPIESFQPIRLSRGCTQSIWIQDIKRQSLSAIIISTAVMYYLLRYHFTDRFYCSNIPSSPNMEYLHELQDLLSNYSPFHILERTRFTDFILTMVVENLGITMSKQILNPLPPMIFYPKSSYSPFHVVTNYI